MSIASFPNPRPRQLLLAMAIFLLHWAVLGWLAGQLGPASRPLRAAEPEFVVAQLLSPEPKQIAALPEPAPAPRPRKPARPAPPAAPAPPPHPADVAAQAPLAEPAEPLAAAGTDATAPAASAQAGAAVAGGGVESLAQAEPAPALPEPRRYRVDMPPPAEMTMDVDRIDADGTRWTGEALIAWKRSGDSYRVTVEAGIRVLFARVNLVVLTSEGLVTDSGFAPSLMTEKRRGRALTATHFNRQDGKITFSASPNAFGLMAGAQDKASVPLQLSAIARADPAQLSGDIDIQVGEDRDASVFHFVVAGQEEIDTRLGRMQTWHLSRPPKPGSYRSRLDVWLAPGRGWYPVRIRNTEASGAVTTQTVNNLVMTDTGI